MRSFRLVAVCCLCACAAAFAAEPPAASGDAALLGRIVAAQRTIDTMSGSFTLRSRHIDDAESEGSTHAAHFDLRIPDHYNVEFTKPTDADWRLRLCSDGTRRWKIEQLFPGDPPDVTDEAIVAGGDAAMFARIVRFFRVDDQQLGKDFQLVATAKPDGGSRLRMTPKDPSFAQQVRDIVIDLDQDCRTKTVTFDDPQGNRSTIVIDTAVYNQPIDAKRFSYQAPGAAATKD